MTTGTLTIDLTAIVANWRALGKMCNCETAAVIKADAYGLGAAKVGPALAAAGAKRFFVAMAEEGVALRRAIGPGPDICIFSGHMAGDADMIRSAGMVPMINSVDQLLLHVESLPGHPFGLQLDTGMNRLGMEPAEWAAVRDIALAQDPRLIISHLACSDAPDHAMNRAQLDQFREMTDGIRVPRSLAATGGILLGRDYHFDLVRPGVGLYGGLPFDRATPVVTLDIPVIQARDVDPGEAVGYGQSYVADRPMQVATISAGYADGLMRAMGSKARLTCDGISLPVVGRVSMDLITVDVTALDYTPEHLQLIGAEQPVEDLAAFAGTIGYEVLTSLGSRYDRIYLS